MNEFSGFSRAGLDFLTELGKRDKAWLDANKKRYQELIVAPSKAFVIALGAQLNRDISSGLVAEPKTNGSISPINNDLRFSPDKPPYKDHLMFSFWEGAVKKTAPTLRVRMSADTIGFAVGMPFEDLERWRTLVAADATGKPLAAAIAKLVKSHQADVVGQELKKVPKPYPDDHAREALLRHKSLQVRWPCPAPKSITSAAFVDWCAKRLATAAPLHMWLVKQLS